MLQIDPKTLKKQPRWPPGPSLGSLKAPKANKKTQKGILFVVFSLFFTGVSYILHPKTYKTNEKKTTFFRKLFLVNILSYKS